MIRVCWKSVFSFFLLASCGDDLAPRVLDSGGTGAAIATTPSTFGITSVSPAGQVVCTEPRPSASAEFASAASGEAQASVDGSENNLAAIREAEAKIAGSIAEIAKVGATVEFERVEFLSHGLFGICQLLTTEVGRGLTAADLRSMVETVVEASTTLSEDEET